MKYSETIASFVVGDRDWVVPAVAILVIAVIIAAVVYANRLKHIPLALLLRTIGLAILVGCLVNPLWSSQRPRRGANVLAVIADTSISLTMKQSADSASRGETLLAHLQNAEKAEPPGWLTRVAQDFELRRYTIDEKLTRIDNFESLTFTEPASNMMTALQAIRDRYRGQPLAGVLVITDGNATDLTTAVEELDGLPPVFPVLIGEADSMVDAAVARLDVTESAFDDAPVSVQVRTQVAGLDEGKARFIITDRDGVPIKEETIPLADAESIRLQLRPTGNGPQFFGIRLETLNDAGERTRNEQTTENNERMFVVDRDQQPRRILYVTGRPNWEFKFLRRAVQTDDQMALVGLVRVAKKEAKFDFRGHLGESTSSLFRGFDQIDEETEEYDEPVLIRIGTRDEEELKSGFPETADDLFSYDGIILDDVEADFFSADQHSLIREYVSRRGGALLMLGGQESFRRGEYDRTPVGEMLPVDLAREAPAPSSPTRIALTRDGMLQPWVRLREEEASEEQRLSKMPEFRTLNASSFVRPGAIVMMTAQDTAGNAWPALVVHRFGRGRVGAMAIGDLWRWRLREGLNRDENPQSAPAGIDGIPPIATAPASVAANDADSDQARSARQLLRWLVADIPRRLDVSVEAQPALGAGVMRVIAKVRTRDFNEAEDADVRVTMTAPDGTKQVVVAEATDVPGVFEAIVSSPAEGPCEAAIVATVEETVEPDSDEVAESDELTEAVGWVYQPRVTEMASVIPNRKLMEQIAAATGGRVLTLDEVADFASSLESMDVPVTERWTWPVWNQWWVFAIAIGCFFGEWTIRRKRGLP